MHKQLPIYEIWMNFILLKLCVFWALRAPWSIKSVSKRSKILLLIFVDNFKPSSMVKTNLKNFEPLRSYMSISTPYIDISWWIKKRYRKYIYKWCNTIVPSLEWRKGEGGNLEAAPVSSSTFISSLNFKYFRKYLIQRVPCCFRSKKKSTLHANT